MHVQESNTMLTCHQFEEFLKIFDEAAAIRDTLEPHSESSRARAEEVSIASREPSRSRYGLQLITTDPCLKVPTRLDSFFKETGQREFVSQWNLSYSCNTDTPAIYSE